MSPRAKESLSWSPARIVLNIAFYGQKNSIFSTTQRSSLASQNLININAARTPTRFVVPPGCPRVPQETPRGSRCPRKPQETPGNPRKPREVRGPPGCPRVPQETPRGSWSPQKTPGNPTRSVVPPSLAFCSFHQHSFLYNKSVSSGNLLYLKNLMENARPPPEKPSKHSAGSMSPSAPRIPGC